MDILTHPETALQASSLSPSLNPNTGQAAAAPQHRHIQSFVHRRSHFSKAQQLAYAQLLPIWGVPYQKQVLNSPDRSTDRSTDHTAAHSPVHSPTHSTEKPQNTPQTLDFAALFGNTNPVVLEIGCGMGETTAAIAKACPGVNFLGIEVYNAGVATLLQRIEAQGLSNLRLVQHDAVEVLRDMIPSNSLSGLHIYCPDPWPKARHLKRRLIQAPFIANVMQYLQVGAYIHCATDVQDYAAQMLSVLSSTAGLRNLSVVPADAGYHPAHNPIAQRPTTKFEARGQRLGHGMWDVVFVKHAH